MEHDTDLGWMPVTPPRVTDTGQYWASDGQTLVDAADYQVVALTGPWALYDGGEAWTYGT